MANEVQTLHATVADTEAEENANKVILEYYFSYAYSKPKSFKG
jgi:hypothetical protein